MHLKNAALMVWDDEEQKDATQQQFACVQHNDQQLKNILIIAIQVCI